jgi:cytidylate kinase
MYRCVALRAMRIGAVSEMHIADIASTSRIEFEPGEPQRVLLDGEDVTEAIRTLDVGRRASEVSVFSGVRRALVKRQRDLVAKGGCVLEGRDVTTVVAPDAQVKVFLTASIEERARRRWMENKSNSLQDVVKDVVGRDYSDYTRADSPLTLAEDATIIESFGITAEEVAKQIIALAKKKK